MSDDGGGVPGRTTVPNGPGHMRQTARSLGRSSDSRRRNLILGGRNSSFNHAFSSALVRLIAPANNGFEVAEHSDYSGGSAVDSHHTSLLIPHRRKPVIVYSSLVSPIY